MPLSILFPPKCTLCRKLLSKDETDFCEHCQVHSPLILNTKRRIPHIAHWTAVWYYKDDVRKSIHRFKFSNARSYADVFARCITTKIMDGAFGVPFDCITWAPTSLLRKLKRGYDQSELLARSLAKQLGVPALRLLKKVRNTPAQSGLRDSAARRANVVNAYRIISAEQVTGKRILLVDDVLTTGATASECAKILTAAGAKDILLATIAVTQKD
jgi:ComF family protein